MNRVTNRLKFLFHKLNSSIQLINYDIALVLQRMNDWAELERYRQANLKLDCSSSDRVIFFGDSITDGWNLADYFANDYINRGINGQTTSQMLVRFRPDVIALKPRVVVILAGTNDLAGNTGPMQLTDIQNNLMSIAELAKLHKIRVVFASILPVQENQLRDRPLEKIKALNDWLEQYCAANDCVYLDYYLQMIDDRELLRSDLSEDGLHPNEVGYKIMAPLAEAAIQLALRSSYGMG